MRVNDFVASKIPADPYIYILINEIKLMKIYSSNSISENY